MGKLMSFWEWDVVQLWTSRLNSSLTNATTRGWKRHSNLDCLMLPWNHTSPDKMNCSQVCGHGHRYWSVTIVQKHYSLLCRREAAITVLAACAEAWWDGKKPEDSWAVLLCSSFVFLHLQLTVPLGSRDQTLSSTDPTFSTNTLCLPSHLPPL